MATYHRTSYEQLESHDPELYRELLNWVRFGNTDNSLINAAVHNDFEQVMCYCDYDDLATLIVLAKTIYNYVPREAWREHANIMNWEKQRQLNPWPEFEFGKML